MSRVILWNEMWREYLIKRNERTNYVFAMWLDVGTNHQLSVTAASAEYIINAAHQHPNGPSQSIWTACNGSFWSQWSKCTKERNRFSRFDWTHLRLKMQSDSCVLRRHLHLQKDYPDNGPNESECK